MEGKSGLNRNQRILALLAEAKGLALEYRTLTGKPLGITGEVAEYEAARLLGVELTPARQAQMPVAGVQTGTAARINSRREGIRRSPDGALGRTFRRSWIYEADRQAVVAALSAPGSPARNERGALAVSKFKSIGHEVWRRPA